MTDGSWPHLILYLDQGTTLSLFAEIGTLNREMAPYRRLAEAGCPVTVLSWAKGEDSKLAAELAAIKVIQNGTRLPNRVWMLLKLMRLRADFGPDAVLITNQLHGAYLPAVARLFNRVDMVLRFGYLASLNLAEEHGAKSWRVLCARINEAISARGAVAIIATTRSMRDIFVARQPLARNKFTIVPNFVSDAFVRLGSERVWEPQENRRLRLVYTGRLVAAKQVDLIIQALALSLGHHLSVIGHGPEGPRLEAMAAELGVSVFFHGTVAHEALPEIYRDRDVFATMTEYEGHPKATIEAMAAGLVVVAPPVRGVDEVITDEVTGLLVEPTPRALAAALDRLAGDAALRRRLGSAAARQAAQRYGLDSYVASIAAIISQRPGQVSAAPQADGHP